MRWWGECSSELWGDHDLGKRSFPEGRDGAGGRANGGPPGGRWGSLGLILSLRCCSGITGLLVFSSLTSDILIGFYVFCFQRSSTVVSH